MLNVSHPVVSKRKLYFVLPLCLFLCLPLQAPAQTTAATIDGIVTDPSGAAVGGAKIQVLNEGTSEKIQTSSNGDGSYSATGLPVGHYLISIEKNGFQAYSVSGIDLEPGVVRTVNVALRLGSVNNQVTVQANAAQIETSTSEVANQVNQAQVETLPLNGRNYQSLAALMPGVLNTQAGSTMGFGGHYTTNAMSINGMGQTGTYYTLDGIWNMNTGNMTQTTIMPNPDTIEEVRVLQNNYSPKYSIMGASVVMIQTRSGTQDFHGNAFEYLRNTDLDSRNFFSPKVPIERQNIFGGTLGGAVFIPHLYNKSRTKTFFFFNVQLVRRDQGLVTQGASPSADMRDGLFSTKIVDPSTGAPFPQNSSGQYVIPSSRINQPALSLLNALAPLPNNPAGGFLNYLNSDPQILNQVHTQVRADHNLTDKERLSGGFFNISEEEHDPSHNGGYATTQQYNPGVYRLAFLQLTSILSPTMVNQLTFGMNMDVHDYDLTGTYLTSQVPGLDETLPYNGFLSNRLPLISFTGGWSTMGVSGNYGEKHLADLESTMADDWSRSVGKHLIEAGFNLVLSTKRQSEFALSNGQWNFNGQFTGNPIADYLLGDAYQFTQVSTVRRMYIHAHILAPYIQDRWKMNRKLTLNYGLRLQFMPLPSPQQDFESIFEPSDYDPSKTPIVNPNGTLSITPGYSPANGLIRDGVNGVPQNFSNSHNWYWMPMAGFAYDLFGDGTTALRGGYGITYERVFTGTDCTFYCGSNYPDVQSITLVNPIFPNPIGTGAQTPPGAPTLSTQSPDLQASRVQTYSITLDREFLKNWTASVGLVGNTADHLGRIVNINQPGPVSGYNFDPAINRGAFAYQHAPYLGYASISDYVSDSRAKWYGLVASVKHAFNNGVFLSASYTLSHGLSESRGSSLFAQSTGTQDVYHPFADYGDSNLDARQMAGISLIWNIPGFTRSTALARTALSGWKYSVISTLRTGLALDPGLSIANQGLATRPNLISPISYAHTVGQWFSTSSFAAPAQGFFGNAGTGILRGPGLVDFDMALYKDFSIVEHHVIQFRAEAFNSLNHTNFNAVSTTYGSGTFGHVTSALDPRIMELALRYQF